VIDPEARAYLDFLASLGLPPLAEQGAVEARRLNSLRAPSLAGELEDVALIEDGRLPGPGGPIAFRLYTPAPDRTLPVLLYLHGGGWVVGDLDTHDSVCRALARRADCVVVSLDYRLAPENRFPAPVEDAWAGLNWLRDHAHEIGADPDRIAVGGDSSGGNLAAVVAQRSRDRAGPPIAAQVLIYPVTDCSFETASYRDNAEGYLLTRAAMEFYWRLYLRDESDAADHRASPLRAHDLSNLPAATVITAEYDPLRDEGRAYAERLREAGSPVVYREYAGLVHGFATMAGALDAGRAAVQDAAAELRAAFRVPSSAAAV